MRTALYNVGQDRQPAVTIRRCAGGHYNLVIGEHFLEKTGRKLRFPAYLESLASQSFADAMQIPVMALTYATAEAVKLVQWRVYEPAQAHGSRDPALYRPMNRQPHPANHHEMNAGIENFAALSTGRCGQEEVSWLGGPDGQTRASSKTCNETFWPMITQEYRLQPELIAAIEATALLSGDTAAYLLVRAELGTRIWAPRWTLRSE